MKNKGIDSKKLKRFIYFLLLTLIGVEINFGLSTLCSSLNWPLFLDCVGIILVSSLGGLIPGIAVGIINNALNCLYDATSIYYAVVSIFIAYTAYFFSINKLFKNWWGWLIAYALFVFYGGFFGSLLTWFLYGGGIGSGVSATLANYFCSTAGFQPFQAQLTADVLIDLLDKLIVVIIGGSALYFIPDKLKKVLPLGYIYYRKEAVKNDEDSALNRRKVKRNSVKTKIMFITAMTELVVGVLFAFISVEVFKSDSLENYQNTCSDYAKLVSLTVDGNQIDDFITYGDNTTEYKSTESKLDNLLSTSSQLT